MPTFQMILLLPKFEKAVLKPILKRSAEYIFEVGGTIRKMENLGLQQTPYKIKGSKHPEANYFLVDFDTALGNIPALRDKFNRDKDVLRMTSFLQSVSPEVAAFDKKPECTLHLDLLPPPYRPSVIAMQSVMNKEKKKLEKNKFKYNSGLDYCPF